MKTIIKKSTGTIFLVALIILVMPLVVAEEEVGDCGPEAYWNQSHNNNTGGCFWNGTINMDYFEELNPMELENSTFDVVQAHDFQYGSEGWNEVYIPQQLRDALNRINVNSDGSINKTSYPEQLVSCVGDECYLQIGKTQSFIIVLLQMVSDWISDITDRVTGTEDRLDTIEEDLCNQGYAKYC